ncbi:MAG TPA: hypothetical protein VNH11_19685 [Pirellulales bacterium]|nr:hypothetical protein [Pirellulales bacterium]
MKVQGWFAPFCVALLTVVASAADDTPRAGGLGDRVRLAIEGAKTFSRDEIREALFNELEVVAASNKVALLDTFTAIVAEKMIAGYQCAGFPDVKVAVAAGGDQIGVTLDEGDRYTQGEVRVIGCQAIDADRIQQELTQPKAKGGTPPLWAGDAPASFNAEYQTWLRSKVTELAGDQGYYRATLKVSIEPDRETKKGTLKVEVADEGACSKASDIVYAGVERDREALRPYLALDPRAPLTRGLRERIEQRLERSGRFVRVQWRLGDPEKRDDEWRPLLYVEEYKPAPPLDGPLTREEAALLKLAEWVERFDERDEELLIRFPDEQVSVVFAPRHGFIILLEPPREAAADQNGAGFLSALVMAEERVGLYSLAQRRKIDAAPPPAPIMGNSGVVQSRVTLPVGVLPAPPAGSTCRCVGYVLTRPTQGGESCYPEIP